MKRVTRFLAAILVVAIAVPAIAQVTDEDIDRAREEANALLANSEQLGRDVQDAWAHQFALDEEIADLGASIEFARAQIVEAERKLEEVAVEMYMSSASSASIQMLFSLGDEEYEAGLEYLREISADEVDVVNQLRSFRSELDRQTERLVEASSEQEELTAQLETMATDLQEDLVAAQAVYEQLIEERRVEEEARRQAEEEARRQAEEEAVRNAAATTTIVVATTPTTSAGTAPTTEAATTTTTPPGSTTTTDSATTTTVPPAPSGGTCPVAGAVSFSDTWGAPRSGGRSHEGVDIIAARNTPVVAIYSGTIKGITTGSLSGLAVRLRADNGDEFFYAHMESYGDISVGQSVPQGYVIGGVGTSGNAPDWLPHVHFEWHPGGGSAANPYPLVKSLCG